MIFSRGRFGLLSSFLCFIGGCTVGSWVVVFYQLQFDRLVIQRNYPSDNALRSEYPLSKNEDAEGSEILLVILIMSGPNNFDNRETLRSTWLKLTQIIGSNSVRYYFLIGIEGLKENTPELLRKLEREQLVQNDLVLLGSLKDSFLNLTTKLVMGINFLSSNIPHQYLLKCDDDSFVRVDVLVSELEERQMKLRQLHHARSAGGCFHWGFFDGRAKVLKTGKWKELDYNLCDLYIPYALGGGYILSKECTQFIIKNQHVLKRFVNEDVSVGLWLSVISPERRHDVRFDTEFTTRGCSNQYIIQHKITQSEMIERYHSLTKNGHLCPKEFRRRASYVYNWNSVPSKCCIRNSSII